MKSIFLSLISLFMVTMPVQAAVMLSGGLSHEYTVTPGGQLTGILELRNTDNMPAEIKVYQEDVKIQENGYPQFIQSTGGAAHNRSNITWVSLNTDRITLAPKEKRTVTYTLKVPNNSSMTGTYWSMLVLEPVSNKSRESQLHQNIPEDQPTLTVSQKMRYAVQVLTHMGGSNSQGANLSFVSPKIESTNLGKRVLNFKIKNTGDRYSRPNVWLDVFSREGKKVKRIAADMRGLFAGENDDFQIDLDDLKPDQYKCLLAAEDHSTGQIFGSDINLTIKPKT